MMVRISMYLQIWRSGRLHMDTIMTGSNCCIALLLEALTMEEAKTAHYHVQADVPRNQSPYKHLRYIAKHDEAKKIEQIDYKNLPQRTKKQKKILSSGRESGKEKSVSRVLDLFAELEAKEGLARVSFGYK